MALCEYPLSRCFAYVPLAHTARFCRAICKRKGHAERMPLSLQIRPLARGYFYAGTVYRPCIRNTPRGAFALMGGSSLRCIIQFDDVDACIVFSARRFIQFAGFKTAFDG
jgi:hypothetical protein